MQHAVPWEVKVVCQNICRINKTYSILKQENLSTYQLSRRSLPCSNQIHTFDSYHHLHTNCIRMVLHPYLLRYIDIESNCYDLEKILVQKSKDVFLVTSTYHTSLVCLCKHSPPVVQEKAMKLYSHLYMCNRHL